ncbi:GNAT family N-acetyltransferase [Dactylosporangium darangshiense]|uniref:GNAT family N-acetyltransferase n=1 Tax=Dactylosporangium darangshiense TaxID=579108 RepID=UPI0031EF909C
MHMFVHTALMSVDRAESFSDLRLTPVDVGDEAGIKAAIALGNRSRATLGPMPFAAYTDAAGKGTLLLAYTGDQVIGYALYALARSRVRLAHLCVDQAFRNRRVALRMVEFISDRHADHLGIAVRCRHNYNLGEMWIKLGFTQLGERPGRGKDRQALVDWWRDHHHGHLFTPDPETVLVRAAVDMNVLRDMAEQRHDSEESRSLLADHLIGLLELVRTAALDAEINAMSGDRRAKFARQAQPFTAVRTDPDRQAQIAREIQTEAQASSPGYPRTDQDRRDLQHVADAVAANLNVFITRDENLGRTLGFVGGRYGLRILRPVDVVVHIDELVRAESYRPVELLSTEYSQQLIGSGHEDDALPLASTGSGERPRDLVNLIRGLALAGHDRVGIFTPAGDITAVFSAHATTRVLEVPLLRVANDGLADTFARQLMFLLREHVRTTGVDTIRISDRHLSPAVRLAAYNEGFHFVDGHLYGYALDVAGPAAVVEHRAVLAARQVGLPEPPPLRSSMPAVAAAELERIWWPAKITDSALRSYLIPIQQAYSADLLGIPSGLLPRNNALGLTREHVYYKRPGGIQVKAPARLLWYMSGGGSTTPQPAAVIACSQLDEVVVGAPDELHDRFQHLGVWDRATVGQAARGGRVQALRFTNTEIFPTPVPRARLRELSQRYASHDQVPFGPLPIPADLFTALYEEGRTP